MEIRLENVKLEYNQDNKKIGGYINVVERESETMFSHERGKWFKEVMKTGVFDRALKKNDNIPLLLEHDWNKQLAHTKKGTLFLKEDSIGLRFDAIVSEEIFNEISRRNINSCSFGFYVTDDDIEEINSLLEKRYVKNIDLLEVSLVEHPAYIGSLVEERALKNALENKEKATEETIETESEEIRKTDKNTDEEIEESEGNEVIEENEENESSKKEEDKNSSDEKSEISEESEKKDEERKCEEENEKEKREYIEFSSEQDKQKDKEIINEVIQDVEDNICSLEEQLDNQKDYINYLKQEVAIEENNELGLISEIYKKWLQVEKLKKLIIEKEQ